jgi:lactate dehydrogenase-like 2-hydroxyacid dehydrogenase
MGATVGILVGGRIGNAIARDREYNVGMRLSLPTLY